MLALAVVILTANAGAAAYLGYSLYHAVKSGGGYGPLEARVRARLHRKRLDPVLAEILRDTDKR